MLSSLQQQQRDEIASHKEKWKPAPPAIAVQRRLTDGQLKKETSNSGFSDAVKSIT